jgi:hypothetical protein
MIRKRAGLFKRVLRYLLRRLQCEAVPLCLFVVLILFTGCAGHHLPPMESVSEQEGVRVRTVFYEMVELVSSCSDGFDADVTVRAAYNGFLGNKEIALDGFLLAGKPSFLKYVAVNPLGQPMIILTTDGIGFRYAVVADSKEYVGSVFSETFRRFFPSGLGGDFYNLLTGRPDIENVELISIGRDRDSPYYWLTMNSREDNKSTVSYLFDPVVQQLIGCHVRDREGNLILEIDYHYKTIGVKGEQQCRLPSKVAVSSPSLKSSFSISFTSLDQDVVLTDEDFSFSRPENFTVVHVK